MTDAQNNTEARIVEEAGGAIAISSPDALTIRYQTLEQRRQIVERLKPLGWLYPVDKADETGTRLLILRRTLPPEEAPSEDVILVEAALSARLTFAFFILAFMALGAYAIGGDLKHHDLNHALFLLVAYGVVTVVVLMGGLRSMTLKVRLSGQEIGFKTVYRTFILEPGDVQRWMIETVYSRGKPSFSFHIMMKDGTEHIIPAPFKGFQNLQDELKKRYNFSVLTQDGNNKR